MAKVEHVKSSKVMPREIKRLKALARDVFDKSEPSTNTVAEKQDCSIYIYTKHLQIMNF
jgi:hypothetical protein